MLNGNPFSDLPLCETGMLVIPSPMRIGGFFIINHLAMYLDWFNNFASIAGFAEYYGITKQEAQDLIEEQRAIPIGSPPVANPFGRAT